MKECRVMASSGGLGEGFPDVSLKQGLSWEPHVIVAQGTSTDAGPGWLSAGLGIAFGGRDALKKDLERYMTVVKEHGVMFICSAGLAGADIHLERVLRVIDEIARKKGQRFQIAVISGEINKEYIKDRLRQGDKMRRVTDTPRLHEYLTIEEVDRSSRIVAQMGPEPILKALDQDVEIVVTGRALDSALFAAMPLKMGIDKSTAMHMAKTIECGAQAAEPSSGSDGVFAICKEGHFLVKPLNPARRCTTVSVAAHALYERSDPYKELNPGGYLHLGGAKYEQYDERTVKVSGGKWVTSPEYTVKIEGAALRGYRTITVCGTRDPILIRKIDEALEGAVKEAKEKLFAGVIPEEDYEINFRLYGKNGTMGELESRKEVNSHELGIIIDVVAKTQEIAESVCQSFRQLFAHYDFGDMLCTAGNLAYPFSPMEVNLGPVYSWNVWHLMKLEEPCEPFQIKVLTFPRGEK